MQVSRLMAEVILKDSAMRWRMTYFLNTDKQEPKKPASRDGATTRRLKTEKDLF